MILRDYQRKALDALRSKIDERPVLVQPTGSGKTCVLAHLINEWEGPVLFVVHRRELLTQAVEHLARLGVQAGAILSGIAPASEHRVQVASVQTLARRVRPPATLVIFDEAHHVVGDSFHAVVDAYPDAAIAGCTATPYRLDGRGLGEVFRSIVVGAYLDELVADGTLIAPRIFTVPLSVNPDGVKKTAGDFNLQALGALMNTKQLVGDLVEHWKKHEPGRTVVYAVDVAHSLEIQKQFQEAGIPARHLDGKTDKDTRATILDCLRLGHTRVVTNCQVLTEGWDLPALDCAIVARPTASLCLHLQMLGRVMRTAEGKTRAIVLDHAGNIRRLGMPDQRIAYSLDGKAKATADGFQTCPACGCCFDIGETECPECGHVREAPEQKPVEIVPGELVEAASEPDHAERSAAFDAIEQLRCAYGFKEGWSAYRFKARFGCWPLVLADEEGRRRLCDARSGGDRARAYKEWLATALAKGFRRGWASWQYRTAFGKWPRFGPELRDELGIDELEDAIDERFVNPLAGSSPGGNLPTTP